MSVLLKVLRNTAAALTGLLVWGAAQAGYVTYNGAVFGFDWALQSGTTYTVTYTADFTSATWASSKGSQLYLGGVNWKIDPSDLTSITLTAAPSGIAKWSSSADTNLSNNGCSGGGSEFACSQLANLPTDRTLIPTTGTYSWTWTAVFGSAITADQLGNPIRAWFLDGTLDNKGDAKGAGLMSLTTTSENPPDKFVPEPGVLALFGMGLVGIAAVRIRRRT